MQNRIKIAPSKLQCTTKCLTATSSVYFFLSTSLNVPTEDGNEKGTVRGSKHFETFLRVESNRPAEDVKCNFFEHSFRSLRSEKTEKQLMKALLNGFDAVC